MDQRKAAQDKMRGMAEAMRLLEEHKKKQAEEKVWGEGCGGRAMRGKLWRVRQDARHG